MTTGTLVLKLDWTEYVPVFTAFHILVWMICTLILFNKLFFLHRVISMHHICTMHFYFLSNYLVKHTPLDVVSITAPVYYKEHETESSRNQVLSLLRKSESYMTCLGLIKCDAFLYCCQKEIMQCKVLLINYSILETELQVINRTFEILGCTLKNSVQCISLVM